jgi:hypothetical protein
MRRTAVPVAVALLLMGVAGCDSGDPGTNRPNSASPSATAASVDPEAITEQGVGPFRIGGDVQPLLAEGILVKETDGFCPLSFSGTDEWKGIWILPDDSGSRIEQIYIDEPMTSATVEGIQIGSPGTKLAETYGTKLRRYTSKIYAESKFDLLDHGSVSIAFYADETGNVKRIMVGKTALLEMAAEYGEPAC